GFVGALGVRQTGNIVAATKGRGAYDLPAGTKPPIFDFSVSSSPASQTASRGENLSVVFNVSRTGGLSDPITISPPDTGGLGIKVKPAGPVAGDSARF